MRPSVESVDKLMAYLKDTENPHIHRQQDLLALRGSIKTAGFKNLVLLWENAETGKVEIIYGSGRIQAANQDGMTQLPVAWALDLDDVKAKFLRVADNRVNQLASHYDEVILTNHMSAMKVGGIDYDFLKFDKKYEKAVIQDLATDADSIFRDINRPAPPLPLGGLPPIKRNDSGDIINENTGAAAPFLSPGVTQENADQEDVPATVYPTDNEWEIPLLKLTMQAKAVEVPVVQWGDISRKTRIFGTYHFYCEDVKFRDLMFDPTPPLRTGAMCLVEPNYSMYKDCRMGEAIGYIYHKRYAARTWQEFGVPVFVDLNVNERFFDINMLGVPDGWRAYFTRGYSEYPEKNLPQYDLACERAGSNDILFVVYGGGKTIEKVAQDNGWTWIEDRRAMNRQEWTKKFNEENRR
jgi:ParB-like chromosome segregation protein Spo0J